jgi:tetratricopeptide (TPR) repeat protein
MADMTEGHAMRRIALAALIGLATAGLFAPAPAKAASALDCFSQDMDLRIKGCSELLKSPLGPDEKAQAYASRALGLSMKGWYAEAIKDYDRSLEIAPNNAVPLNNRAWAYFRWGKPAEGRDDVEKSIRLDPTSGASFDTRAHIDQALGNPKSALADYKRAITFGGKQMTKMYQCGLTEHGLYKGPLDGIPNQELTDALAQCVEDTACDPLPADEECRFGVS